jgi:hypothetical protein
MATLEEVRAEIVARIASVPNVGVVHDHEPYAADMGSLRNFYVSEIGGEALMQGWFVRRTARERVAESKERRAITEEWQIRGYRALSEDNGSEKAFDALIEAISARFDADDYVVDLWLDTQAAEVVGVQLLESKPVMFAGVLCHCAEMRLYTKQRV